MAAEDNQHYGKHYKNADRSYNQAQEKLIGSLLGSQEKLVGSLLGLKASRDDQINKIRLDEQKTMSERRKMQVELIRQ